MSHTYESCHLYKGAPQHSTTQPLQHRGQTPAREEEKDHCRTCALLQHNHCNTGGRHCNTITATQSLHHRWQAPATRRSEGPLLHLRPGPRYLTHKTIQFRKWRLVEKALLTHAPQRPAIPSASALCTGAATSVLQHQCKVSESPLDINCTICTYILTPRKHGTLEFNLKQRTKKNPAHTNPRDQYPGILSCPGVLTKTKIIHFFWLNTRLTPICVPLKHPSDTRLTTVFGPPKHACGHPCRGESYRRV